MGVDIDGPHDDLLILRDDIRDIGHDADIVVTDAHPYRYNRIIPFSYFNRTGHTQYALGETSGREAVLLFNTHTELTEEKTIEYII